MENKHSTHNPHQKLTPKESKMTADDVVHFYRELEDIGIEIWINGGWGVDALLEHSTRSHGDLDIIVQEQDVKAIRSLLDSKGYKILQRDDLSDINFHLADDQGHEIDFTVIVFDREGNGIFGPAENGEMNPADSFKGMGRINNYSVHCVSPEYAIRFRTGYEIRKRDYKDVKALVEKFGLKYPEEYIDLDLQHLPD